VKIKEKKERKEEERKNKLKFNACFSKLKY